MLETTGHRALRLNRHQSSLQFATAHCVCVQMGCVSHLPTVLRLQNSYRRWAEMCPEVAIIYGMTKRPQEIALYGREAVVLRKWNCIHLCCGCLIGICNVWRLNDSSGRAVDTLHCLLGSMSMLMTLRCMCTSPQPQTCRPPMLILIEMICLPESSIASSRALH